MSDLFFIAATVCRDIRHRGAKSLDSIINPCVFTVTVYSYLSIEIKATSEQTDIHNTERYDLIVGSLVQFCDEGV